MPNSKTPQELIVEIERKDKRFRIAQSVFMTVLLIGLSVIIFFQFQTVRNADKQINTVKNYLHCAALTPVQDRDKEFMDKCFQE